MGYKPKVVKGRVSDTGWPIDGHVLYLSLWDYCMPRCSSVFLPDTTTWKRVPCSICGTECWLTDFAQKTLEVEPNLKTACTRCALKAAGDIIEEA